MPTTPCACQASGTTTSSTKSPVDIARETSGPPSHRLIAILVASGVTDTAQLAALSGLSIRTVQHVRRATHCAVSTQSIASNAAHCAPEAQPIAPNATHCAQPIAPEKKGPPDPLKENNTPGLPHHFQSGVVAQASARPHDHTTVDLKDLTRRLTEAAGRGIANPAACPNLLVPSDPLAWIEQGCDLELDILPVITARANAVPPGSIRTWRFFAGAVADAKARRQQTMPAGTAYGPRPGAAREALASLFVDGRFVGVPQ